VQVFAEMLKELGFDFSFKGEITPKKIQRVLESAKGRKRGGIHSSASLTFTGESRLSPENIGHFAWLFRLMPILHLQYGVIPICISTVF
jgi:exoribonuclease R